MPNFTPNINLEKPLQEEFYDINIFNANSDKIDTAVSNIANNSYQKPAGGIPLSDISPQISDGLGWYGVATGNNSLNLNIPSFPGPLKAGTTLRFKNNGFINAPMTLNFNGNGAISVMKSNGSVVNSGYTNAVYTVVFDGTSFILQGEGSGGNALAAEILQGRTASTDNGEVVGTMPNRGNFNLGFGVSVPHGYYSGGFVPNGKYSAQGQSILTNDNNYSLINVTGLTFTPSVVIVNFFYGSNFHIKCYGLNGSTNDVTFGSSGLVYNEGGWSIGNGFFRTRLSNSIAHIGVNANWIAYS